MISPASFEGVTFSLKENTLNVNNGKAAKLNLSDIDKVNLLSCLQVMEQFLHDNNFSEVSVYISVRRMFSQFDVIEFNFLDKKSGLNSGIAYSKEQVNDSYKKIKDCWYLYNFGLV